MGLTNPRFAGQRTLEDSFNGLHRIFAGEPDHDAVARIQQALLDLGYALTWGADGDFGNETGNAISSFKVARQIQPADPVVGPKTMAALDADAPRPGSPPLPDPDLRYWDRRSFYINRAFAKAFPDGLPTWQPEDGFAANRANIIGVYNYYRDLYLARPDHLFWAGLGRMAGGAVVGGLDFNGSESVLTRTMVRIGKEIFLDLAWLHEAFLDDPALAVELGYLHDVRVLTADYSSGEPPMTLHRGPSQSYGAAWEQISSGNPVAIAEGNQKLLANEQLSIIQPHYDFLIASDQGWIFERSRAFTENIHPYHRAFLLAFPMSDIRLANDRWAWITEQNGMLEHWVAAGTPERSRLVSLPFDEIIHRQFGPIGRPDLLPPGSQ